MTLSLDDAILLAVRDNPNVQSTRLSEVMQRFNLWVEEWQFSPHYSLEVSALYNQAGAYNQPLKHSKSFNVQPGVSLLTPIGTQLTLTNANLVTGNYNPNLSLQVLQPLMRGFGKAIVESGLNNARDSEVIARLNVEGILRTTVSAVIQAYLDVVSAEHVIRIDEEALTRANLSVKQTKLFIQAGHKAGNELVTVEANVASAKTQLENDRNNLTQARYALLTAIGIDPNTKVNFTSIDVDALINKYHLSSLPKTKFLILKNDIQYQTDDILLHGQTKRNLLIAEDNTRWQLNFTANVVTGNGSGGGYNAGTNSLFNGQNQSQAVGLTLQIPIDDQTRKQSLLSAKIALKQAELAFMQEKWAKETSAINAWNLVISAKQALVFAANAESLQEKTYDVSYQKYLHGLIDSLEWQSAQMQLIQAQQTLLTARVSYLKALVNLDLLIGNTLQTWNIHARLS